MGLSCPDTPDGLTRSERLCPKCPISQTDRLARSTRPSDASIPATDAGLVWPIHRSSFPEPIRRRTQDLADLASIASVNARHNDGATCSGERAPLGDKSSLRGARCAVRDQLRVGSASFLHSERWSIGPGMGRFPRPALVRVNPCTQRGHGERTKQFQGARSSPKDKRPA